jgi:branched-chain amino acid transport system ATP-binding protein
LTAVAEHLSARDIEVRFRAVKAIDAVHMTLREGEILGLIGPNGAGKTTLLNVLSGFLRPTSGAVTLSDRDITAWAPAAIARAGVVRTFQGVRLFPGLTVFENVGVEGAELGSAPDQVSRELGHATRRA